MNAPDEELVEREVHDERGDLGHEKELRLSRDAPPLRSERVSAVAEELHRGARQQRGEPGCRRGDLRHANACGEHREVHDGGAPAHDQRAPEAQRAFGERFALLWMDHVTILTAVTADDDLLAAARQSPHSLARPPSSQLAALQQTPMPQSSSFVHVTEQAEPWQLVRPAHAVGPLQTTVVFVASLSMSLGQVWSPVHETEQLATASVQMICPQALTPVHAMVHSFASQRMVLGQELTPAQVREHRSPRQVMPLPQLARPPHDTSQEVALPQSMPLSQALAELQCTAQGMPAGHSTCSQELSPVHSMVQMPSIQAPCASVHAEVHGGAWPSSVGASAAGELSGELSAIETSSSRGSASVDDSAATESESRASSPLVPAAPSGVVVSVRPASSEGPPF
jgi:hypothetical protein